MYFLLILSLKSILSSVIGSSFYNWFKDKVDHFMDHFAEKHDLELARTESKFRKDYPLIAERLDYLESIAHPKCGLDGFDDYQPLIDRIEALEKRRKKQK